MNGPLLGEEGHDRGGVSGRRRGGGLDWNFVPDYGRSRKVTHCPVSDAVTKSAKSPFITDLHAISYCPTHLLPWKWTAGWSHRQSRFKWWLNKIYLFAFRTDTSRPICGQCWPNCVTIDRENYFHCVGFQLLEKHIYSRFRPRYSLAVHSIQLGAIDAAALHYWGN